MDHLQSNIFIAGQRLNDLTGYSAIEALKNDIDKQEKLVEETRLALLTARDAYATAISQRSTSQRESNELLQRKHAWSSDDLERFTTLYRSDHANEMAESAARDNLAAVEKKAEDAASLLNKCILARYHEEQIWSDKIRRMSTWGTWGLMGVNVLLFLVFQIGVEPWKRKRLVKGFEEKVAAALEREDRTLKDREEEHESVANALTKEDVATPTASESSRDDVPLAESLDHKIVGDVQAGKTDIDFEGPEIQSTSTPNRIAFENPRDRIYDLFSARQITIRKIDFTLAAIEAAATGAAFVVLVALLGRSR